MIPAYTIQELVMGPEASLDVRVQINWNSPVFDGHFPEFKIFPGALLIDLIADILQQHDRGSLTNFTASNIKFLHPILPDKGKLLQVAVRPRTPSPQHLDCTIHQDQICCFRGSLNWSAFQI